MPYETAPPNLFDLLARVWTLPGPIEAACFNADGDAVAFAAASGLSIGPLADAERPEARIRIAADTGRQTIQPRAGAVRPLARVADTCGPVVPWGGRSFLTGRAEGGLLTATPGGQGVRLALPGFGRLATAGRDPASQAVAVADEARCLILPDGAPEAPRTVETPGPVAALGFAPGGGDLAIAHPGGLAFRGAAGGADCAMAPPATLAWSPDGRHLAVGFREPGLALVRRDGLSVETVPDYPTPVASLGWSAPGQASASRTFVTSGAFRIAAWAWTGDGLGEPVEVGRAGLVVVERVAAAPNRPLVAVGYASGLVCLARIGGRDEMLIRGEGAAITALAWSPDGRHLAIGDRAGQAALVAFPDALFK